MKHLFLESHNIQNPYFGFGQFNYHLIKALYEEKDPELKFTLHAKDTAALQQEFGSYFEYKKYRSHTRYPLFRIGKKYDLWHSLNQNTKIEPSYDLLYLMTVHDIHFVEEQAGDIKREARFREKIKRSNALVYISRFAKENTHAHFEIPDIPEYVIYNGNPVTETEIPENFRPDILPTGPYLFSIGEFTDRKNFAALVEMLVYLQDYQLVLSGNADKPYADTIRQSIIQNKLGDRVHITGKISETAKRYYLKNCTAFVFPSLREGFGIPPIEAMTFGKPVIMSNTTSLPEIGGKYAFYWDHYEPKYMAEVVRESISIASQNPDFEKQVRSHAKSFDWNTTANAYINVYRSLLKI